MARHAKESKLLREMGLSPDSSFEFGTLVEQQFEELVRNGFLQTGVIDEVPDPLRLRVRRLATAAAAGRPSFVCQSSEQRPKARERPASAQISAGRAIRRR